MSILPFRMRINDRHAIPTYTARSKCHLRAAEDTIFLSGRPLAATADVDEVGSVVD